MQQNLRSCSKGLLPLDGYIESKDIMVFIKDKEKKLKQKCDKSVKYSVTECWP